MTIHEFNALVAARKTAEDTISTLKEGIADIDRQLADYFAPLMSEKLKAKGKDHGDITIEKDGMKVKGSIRQTVKWDSARLAEIAAKLPQSEAANIFTVSLSVSEDTYQSIRQLGDSLADELTMARVVKLSPFTAKPV